MFEALGIAKFFSSLTPKGWLIIAAIGVAIASVTAIVLIADNRDKRMIETAQDSGRTEAESEGKSVTLDQNRKANDAEDEVRRGGPVAGSGCVSNDRGDGTGCERFAQ